jgi:hypothetical protein
MVWTSAPAIARETPINTAIKAFGNLKSHTIIDEVGSLDAGKTIVENTSYIVSPEEPTAMSVKKARKAAMKKRIK